MHERRYRCSCPQLCQVGCSYDPGMQVVLRARNTCLPLDVGIEIRACEGVDQIRIQSPLVHCCQRGSELEDDVQVLSAESPPSMMLLDVDGLGVRISRGLETRIKGCLVFERSYCMERLHCMTCKTAHYLLELAAICRVIFVRPSSAPDFNASLQGVRQGQARRLAACVPALRVCPPLSLDLGWRLLYRCNSLAGCSHCWLARPFPSHSSYR